jgi:hypothetical protein
MTAAVASIVKIAYFITYLDALYRSPLYTFGLGLKDKIKNAESPVFMTWRKKAKILYNNGVCIKCSENTDETIYWSWVSGSVSMKSNQKYKCNLCESTVMVHFKDAF